MKKPIYILRPGRLRRKDNTIVFEFSSEDDKEGRKVIPVETVESIFIFSEVEMNVRLLNFLSHNSIPVHVFDYYGHYSGTFAPREDTTSGFVIIKQVEHYLKAEKRLEIAKEIVRSSAHNMIRNLRYYQARHGGLDDIIEDIQQIMSRTDDADTVSAVMGIEGQITKRYFDSWNRIIKSNEDAFKFEGRERRPPPNPINALISFGNSLLYPVVLDEIYKTQLNPAVSFLHEPGTRRFSLSLDISEIFKPLLVDRIIFGLINHRQIRPEHFEENLNYTYLNDRGRRVFISEFDQKLETTIRHPKLKRNVSYRTLIRLECYKLIKHVIGEERYEGFRIWW